MKIIYLKTQYDYYVGIGASEHFLVSCLITSIKFKVHAKFITYWNFKYFRENLFISNLYLINWNYICIFKNVDDMINYYSNLNFMHIFYVHGPLRTVTVTKETLPWLTNTLRHMKCVLECEIQEMIGCTIRISEIFL